MEFHKNGDWGLGTAEDSDPLTVLPYPIQELGGVDPHL